MSASPWLPWGPPQDGIALFLLPPAGGSSALFRSWRGLLPPHLAACPVELPGRGRRTDAAPFGDLEELAADIDAACAPPAGRPWAVLGHSMGGLVAAAWAARAHRAGRGPDAVYISAAAPPWLAAVAAPLAALDDDSLWRYVTGLQGVPAGSVAARAARRLLGATLRADIEAAASYRPRRPEPVGCPVTVVAGADDRAFPTALLDAWEQVSTGRFSLRVLPGGHFYRNGLDDLVPLVRGDLDHLDHLARPGGHRSRRPMRVPDAPQRNGRELS